MDVSTAICSTQYPKCNTTDTHRNILHIRYEQKLSPNIDRIIVIDRGNSFPPLFDIRAFQGYFPCFREVDIDRAFKIVNQRIQSYNREGIKYIKMETNDRGYIMKLRGEINGMLKAFYTVYGHY